MSGPDVTRIPEVYARAHTPVASLAGLWREQEGHEPPFTGPRVLLLIKQTGREKDWPIVGELARLLPAPADQLRWSRSARDLLQLAAAHPDLVSTITAERPALATIPRGLDALRIALEQERFAAMDRDSARVAAYLAAADGLEQAWPRLQLQGLPLRAAHAMLVACAERCLPMTPPPIAS